MTSPSHAETLAILTLVERGDERAADRLLPLVYDELHNIAEHHFHRQPSDHTLQPTALIHEAYLKLVDQTGAHYDGRTHFLAVAATAMRQILIDRARRRAAAKHGGGRERLTLLEGLIPASESGVDLLALDGALTELAGLDPRKARVIELRFFGGLSMEETAQVLNVSRTTVSEDWRMARAWLVTQLGEPGAE